jgi:hypothetical protein
MVGASSLDCDHSLTRGGGVRTRKPYSQSVHVTKREDLEPTKVSAEGTDEDTGADEN